MEDGRAKEQCESNPKCWDELTQDEKVERMRSEVKNLQRSINRVSSEMRQIQNHVHGENGVVLFKLRDSAPQSGSHIIGSGGKAYF